MRTNATSASKAKLSNTDPKYNALTTPTTNQSMNILPAKQGLYDPANEHDACGVGFVAHIKGEKSHSIVEQGLTILERVTHRGAVGADSKAGDGAGLLMQIPDEFFQGDAL